MLQNFKTHENLNKRFDINYYSFGNLFQQSDSFSFNENQTDISLLVYKNKSLFYYKKQKERNISS